MTIKEIYEWAVENECENDTLTIATFNDDEYNVNEDMLVSLQYEEHLRHLNKVVISLWQTKKQLILQKNL